MQELGAAPKGPIDDVWGWVDAVAQGKEHLVLEDKGGSSAIRDKEESR